MRRISAVALGAVCLFVRAAEAVSDAERNTSAEMNAAKVEFQLRDGGFEGDGAAEWSFDRNVYTIDPTGGRSGTKALLFDNGKASEVFQRVRVQGGARYRFGVWTRTEKLEGTGFGVRMCVVWEDADHREIDGFYKSPHIIGDNAEWVLCESTAPAIAPDTAVWAKVRPEVVGPVTGRAWLDDAYFEPWDREPVAGVYSSAYRDELYSGKVTFVAAINDVDPAADAAAMRHEFTYVGADGSGKTVPADSFTRTSAELTVDVTDLPVGTNVVCFRLVDAAGKELGSAECTFVRSAEKRRRRVDFDRLGRTLVDGKPFFPLGMYWSVGTSSQQQMPQIDEKTIAEYAKGPFNCVLPYAQLDRRQMDMVYSNGLMVVRSLLFDFGDAAWDPTGQDPEHRYPAPAKRTIESLRDHPGLLAWYVNDEISVSEIVRLKGRLTTVKELDPDHPALAVLYQIESLRDYMGSFDILGTDPYPIGHYHISTAYTWASAAKRATLGVRPVWQIPQAMDWASFNGAGTVKTDRMPTREEMRNMTWQQIAAGANGLIYYSYTYMMLSPTTPFEQAWSDICAVAGEVRDSFDVLLSDCVAPSFVCDNAKVAVRTWRQGGWLYVLAVNLETAAQTACVTLSEPLGKARSRFGAPAVRSGENELVFDLPAIGQALAVVDLPAYADEVAVGVSDPIRVDTREQRRAVSPVSIACSPTWDAAGPVENAYVVIEKVEQTGAGSVRTEELARLPADQAGDWQFALQPDGERCVRLRYRTCVGDVQIGESLECDVSFGESSTPSQAVPVNCDPDGLQRAVLERRPVVLAYDPRWDENGVTVSIEAERVWANPDASLSAATNVLLRSSSAAGGLPYETRRLKRGDYALRCFIRDANGQEACEPLVANFGVLADPGFLMFLR